MISCGLKCEGQTQGLNSNPTRASFLYIEAEVFNLTVSAPMFSMKDETAFNLICIHSFIHSFIYSLNIMNLNI